METEEEKPEDTQQTQQECCPECQCQNCTCNKGTRYRTLYFHEPSPNDFADWD